MIKKRLVTILELSATIGLAILLLSTLLITSIPPNYIGYVVYLGFLFPILYVSNLVSFIIQVFRRRTTLLIPLTALVLTFSLWNTVFQLHPFTEKNNLSKNNSFTILSYNVRMFNLMNKQKESFAPEKLFNFIKQKNPDILCLQEFYAEPAKRKLSQENINNYLSYYPYKKIFYDEAPRSRGIGIAIYSKYPIVSSEYIPFKNSGNSSMSADIKIENKIIRIFNNHLESLRLTANELHEINHIQKDFEFKNASSVKKIDSRFHQAAKSRTSQADLVASLVQKSPFQTIVCGDFNDTPISYTYNTMKGNLKDAFLEFGKGFGGTYNGFAVHLRIDFILHSSSLSCEDFERFKVPYSDHYPIFARFNCN